MATYATDDAHPGVLWVELCEGQNIVKLKPSEAAKERIIVTNHKGKIVADIRMPSKRL